MQVAMLVASIMMVLLGGAFILLQKSTARQSASIDAQGYARAAVLALDKQVRYADAVTTPGEAAGAQWVEWQVLDPTIPAGQSATRSRCYQWRAVTDTGLLQVRSWVVPTSGTVATPAWTTVARGLVLGSRPVFTTDPTLLRAAPFSLPGTSSPLARVGVSFTVRTGRPVGQASVTTVITALNSSAISASACTQVPRA